MRLAEFILANREPILAEWEAFVHTCAPVSGTLDVVGLREHARDMLAVIAADLATPQGRHAPAAPAAQMAPVRGPAPPGEGAASIAAAAHGAGWARSGFTVAQMVAEYRALRASVIRLWTATRDELSPVDVEDLTRFNEAIDQSLAEAIARFIHDVEEAKDTFLAILGHDLRTPLGAIYSSARFMLETGELGEPHLTLATRIAGSAERTLTMVGELLDFTRGRLGGGIPVVRTEVSLGKVVHDVVDELSAAHPGRLLRVETRGAQHGRWDAARLSQALSNLVGNAIEHGAPGTTVTVGVRGDDERVCIMVHNRGAVIPPAELDGIFNPLKARQSAQPRASRRPLGSLGLGLYIAERIVHAHGGHIEVDSTEADGTTFTVYLLRR